MIYTIGDSFTKWHWPTWADWMQKYLNVPVTNLAYPGFSNDTIYWTLMNILPTLTHNDNIYIMWTGTNRICQWYDKEYVVGQDITGFFPDTNQTLWFGNNYRGLYKTHPATMPSYTHMLISTFDIILKSQMLLDKIGCKYTMMFWQNPWADTREVFVPSYRSTWSLHTEKLNNNDLNTANEILTMPVIKNLLSQIQWSTILGVGNSNDPTTYQGLWEYVLADRTLVLHNHNTDCHPNTLAHHEWYTNIIAPKTDAIYKDQAQDQAKSLINCTIPIVDYRKNGILFNQGQLTL